MNAFMKLMELAINWIQRSMRRTGPRVRFMRPSMRRITLPLRPMTSVEELIDLALPDMPSSMQRMNYCLCDRLARKRCVDRFVCDVALFERRMDRCISDLASAKSRTDRCISDTALGEGRMDLLLRDMASSMKPIGVSVRRMKPFINHWGFLLCDIHVGTKARGPSMTSIGTRKRFIRRSMRTMAGFKTIVGPRVSARSRRLTRFIQAMRDSGAPASDSGPQRKSTTCPAIPASRRMRKWPSPLVAVSWAPGQQLASAAPAARGISRSSSS